MSRMKGGEKRKSILGKQSRSYSVKYSSFNLSIDSSALQVHISNTSLSCFLSLALLL